MNSKDWRPTAFVDTAPGVVTEQDAQTWRLDRRRALFAFIRHLMTLATVALVLTVTLIERAFAREQSREVVAMAIGAFLLSLAIGGAAHLALLATSRRVGARHAPEGDGRALLMWSLATFVAFAAGIGALAGFFFVNWFR
jgi:MFS family permease